MITTTRAEPHCQESTSENPIKIACYLWIVLPISICSHAHTWSGISDPSRAIDWSNAGIPDGIPHRTTVCATLNPGVKAEQINRAIAACPAGQVVYLSAGTFHLSTGII